MHPDDRVPFVGRHVDQHAITQNPGVVDQDVEVAEGLDRLVDEPFGAVPVRDVVEVGDSRSAGCLDLVNDLLRGRCVRTGAVGAPAQVVHDDLGPFGREQQRVRAADAASGPGHDRDATIEFAHAYSFRIVSVEADVFMDEPRGFRP